MTTGGVPLEIQPTSSLHRRAVARATATCTTSSMAEMHDARLKDDAEMESMMNWNNVMRGTKITMAPTMTSLIGSVLLKDDTF
jgi:hypothetical protein